jgi:sugar O-acyltransferase (sialic acid O-acetyltransferase NeuD family)
MNVVTPLVIVGAGGFGREIAWLVEEINATRRAYELLGFLDDGTTNTAEGYPILSSVEQWIAKPETGVELVCAMGDPFTRFRIVRRLATVGARFATLIHPEARRSRWVEVGAGSMICAGNILTTNITLAEHCLVNLDCTIGHDSILGAFSSLMPGVHVSGEVRLGEGVYVGTGAAIINGVEVGEWTTIGAGAVISSSLPARVIAVGVPAKPIKPNTRAPDLTPSARTTSND